VGRMQLYAAWRENLEELLLERGGLVLWHTALFVVGLLFGALALRSLEVETQLELARQISGALQALREGEPPAPGPLLREALFRQARTVALMWVLGVSLVGSVAVMALPLVRGFTSGFAVAYLTAE